MAINNGDFIRVSRDSEFRPGQDGMVMQPPDENGDLGLMFHYDRYNRFQDGPSSAIEAWNLSELDIGSLER